MGDSLTPHIHHWATTRTQRREISPNTASQERRALATLAATFGGRPLTQLGRWLIDRWIGAMAGLSAATVSIRFRIARKFFRWLAAEARCPDPTIGLRPPRIPRAAPRALDHVQIGRLFAAAPHSRARAALALMAHMGLRRAEVCRLRFEDWSRHDGTMRVHGKGGHVRVLPVPEAVVRELARYLAEYPAHHGPILRTFDRRACQLSPTTLGAEVYRLALDAQVKMGAWDGVGPHSLRHTCATDILDGGADVRIVQQVLGHQHLGTTARYLGHADLPALRNALEGRSYDDAA